MTENHPITPSPELVREWAKTCSPYDVPADHIATQAARWGADQQLKFDAEQINQAWQKGADDELEACVEWLFLDGWGHAIDRLRADRRPKPPSLKEQALKALRSIERGQDRPEDTETIRRAIEALPND